MAVFVILAAILMVVSLAADSVLIAVVASVFLAQFFYVLLPMDRIRGVARKFWTGEAGEEAYESAVEDRWR